MEYLSPPAQQLRLGWHYFTDAMHYRESDIIRWLPELQSMGASWLTLYTPIDYAIPESFITRLLNAKINPVLHFQAPITASSTVAHIKPLIKTYASWGIRYVMFFDRPNHQSQWSTSGWVQDRLVERFLDIYIPYLEESLSYNLTPIFPPLEPGGSYWDIAFLNDSLSSIHRRGFSKLLDHMLIGAYAKAGNRPLDWGAGGPERWPASQPYFTSKDSQDQCGFRIYDWYRAVSNAILGKYLPMILFGAACTIKDISDKRFPPISIESHTQHHLSIAKALAGEESEIDPLPPEIIACCFWPLVATPGLSDNTSAWYQGNGEQLPIVHAMKNWAASYRSVTSQSKSITAHFNPHPIAHYLLLTEELWLSIGRTSNFVNDFLQKFKPTVGYSVEEAKYARRVTIFGNSSIFPDFIVNQLLDSGCMVERIQEDGTLIAPNISKSQA